MLRSISALAYIWKLIPLILRKRFFLFFFLLESRNRDPRNGLARLFETEDLLTLVINERALALGKGEHPKHRLMGYHEFFIANLDGCQRILDIGCGYGAVAKSIASAYPQARVTGIDNNASRLQQAINSSKLDNLDYCLVDLEDFETELTYDAVILSNVLEHLHDRVNMLRLIQRKSRAAKYLIRVPLFERNWTIAMRKELNVNYFQDDDHKIEHTLEEFYKEIEESGLNIVTLKIIYGEIWSVCAK